MNRSLIVLFALIGLLSGGFLWLGKTDARTPPRSSDIEWVNANFIRVKVDGRWRDVPMIPLSDRQCKSHNPLYERYCVH